jgi:hypothetical protein
LIARITPTSDITHDRNLGEWRRCCQWCARPLQGSELGLTAVSGLPEV